jgi:hypothetical protein
VGQPDLGPRQALGQDPGQGGEHASSPNQLGLQPILDRAEHRDHVASGQHLPNGGQRHVKRPQQADRQRLTGLLGPVVAIAGARIHPRWPQQAQLVVVP